MTSQAVCDTHWQAYHQKHRANVVIHAERKWTYGGGGRFGMNETMKPMALLAANGVVLVGVTDVNIQLK